MMLNRAWQTPRSKKTGPHGTRTASRFAAPAARAPARRRHRHTRGLGRPRAAAPPDLRRHARRGHAARRAREGGVESQAVTRAPRLGSSASPGVLGGRPRIRRSGIEREDRAHRCVTIHCRNACATFLKPDETSASCNRPLGSKRSFARATNSIGCGMTRAPVAVNA